MKLVSGLFLLGRETLLSSPCLTTFSILSARELENPFINVPNDLPLCTFQVRNDELKIILTTGPAHTLIPFYDILQAQYNEALGTMFCGYHPDSWFTVENEAKRSSFS